MMKLKISSRQDAAAVDHIWRLPYITGKLKLKIETNVSNRYNETNLCSLQISNDVYKMSCKCKPSNKELMNIVCGMWLL